MAGQPRMNQNPGGDSIKEMRLRQLQDYMDAANYKKVLSHADHLLNKDPTLKSALAFKGLAYLRLGNIESCVSIVNELKDEVPTDDNTLHVMSLIYRDVDMSEMICKIYEQACEKEPTEELMCQLFMTYVRIADFGKQSAVALRLWKSFQKPAYLLYAVMSLFLKAAFEDEKTIAEKVSLPLAVRYLQTMKNTTGTLYDHDNAFMLYVMILKHKGDYATLLQELRSCPERAKLPDHKQEEIECLEKLDDLDGLCDTIERNILDDPGNLLHFQLYIDRFGHTKPERVVKYISEISQKSSEEEKHTALLALIIVAQHLAAHKIDPASHGLVLKELFIQYFLNYGSKPIFIRDMRDVLITLRSSDSDVLNSFENDMKNNSGPARGIAAALQWKTNFFEAKYLLHEPQIISQPKSLIGFIGDLLEGFQSSDAVFRATVGKDNIDPKTSFPYSDLLATGISVMAETFWAKLGFWSGYYLQNGVEKLSLAEGSSTEHQENGVNKISVSQHFSENDFPLYIALALGVYGVDLFPQNPLFKHFLMKLYLFCGASHCAKDYIMNLDMKHMQIDSMGYLWLPKITASGLVPVSREFLNGASSYYAASSKDVLEQCITSYKIFAWEGIVKALGLKDSMITSLQKDEVRVEKRLHEFLWDGSTREQLIKVAEQEEYDPVVSMCVKFSDNRDFMVYPRFATKQMERATREVTFQDSIARLRFRSSIQAGITYALRAVANPDNPRSCRSHLEQLQSVATYLNECLERPHEEFKDNPKVRYFHGPWPPSSYDYANSGMPDMMCQMFKMIVAAGTVAIQPNGAEHAKSIGELLALSISKFSDTVDFILRHWKGFDMSLVGMTNLHETLFILVETVAYLCITTDCIRGLLEKSGSTQASNVKGKKRKEKRENFTGAPWAEGFNTWVQGLLSQIEKLSTTLEDLEKEAVKRWSSRSWKDADETFWKGKVPENLLEIIAKSHGTINRNIATSHVASYRSMIQILERKKPLIQKLLIK